LLSLYQGGRSLYGASGRDEEQDEVGRGEGRPHRAIQVERGLREGIRGGKRIFKSVFWKWLRKYESGGVEGLAEPLSLLTGIRLDVTLGDVDPHRDLPPSGAFTASRMATAARQAAP